MHLNHDGSYVYGMISEYENESIFKAKFQERYEGYHISDLYLVTLSETDTKIPCYKGKIEEINTNEKKNHNDFVSLLEGVAPNFIPNSPLNAELIKKD